MIDFETKAAFVKHVRRLEEKAGNGNMNAARSLACMALLVEGWRPTDPSGGGEVIDFAPYLKMAS